MGAGDGFVAGAVGTADATEPEVGGEDTERALAGGGGTWLIRCDELAPFTPFEPLNGDAIDGSVCADGMVEGPAVLGVPPDERFGSEARPGGGGGFDGEEGGEMDPDGDAARSEPDWDGSGGGDDTRPCETGGGGGTDADDGSVPWLGGCAGPGIPTRVRFISAAALR